MLRLQQDKVAWHDVEGTIICLDLVHSRYLSINAAGATLWPRLVAGAERDELIAALRERFAIDQTRAETDVAAFITDLDQRGLIEQH